MPREEALPDHYEVLGVSCDADPAALKAAFAQLVADSERSKREVDLDVDESLTPASFDQLLEETKESRDSYLEVRTSCARAHARCSLLAALHVADAFLLLFRAGLDCLFLIPLACGTRSIQSHDRMPSRPRRTNSASLRRTPKSTTARCTRWPQ